MDLANNTRYECSDERSSKYHYCRKQPGVTLREWLRFCYWLGGGFGWQHGRREGRAEGMIARVRYRLGGDRQRGKRYQCPA